LLLDAALELADDLCGRIDACGVAYSRHAPDATDWN
jgi:hypothetical protein